MLVCYSQKFSIIQLHHDRVRSQGYEFLPWKKQWHNHLFSYHYRKSLVRRKPENPAKSSLWSRSAAIWTIVPQTDELHMALTLNLGVSRSFLVFKYVYPLLESQYVLSQVSCLILTTSGACLFWARNRKPSDGHVSDKELGSGPKHIWAGWNFLPLWKCSAKSSSPTRLFTHKWIPLVQWTVTRN